MSSTINARSHGRLLRSRNGCITCRQKKVKCDEEHPSCGRCKRLGEACTWPEPPQGRTSTEKRRREKENWRPKQLLPNTQPTVVAGAVDNLAAIPAVEPSLPWTEGLGNLATIGWEEWCFSQHTTPNLEALPEDPGEFFDFEKSPDQDFLSAEDTTFYFEITTSIPSSLRHIWDISNSNFGVPSPLDMMDPSFQGSSIALSPCFEFGSSERRALHHYQHFFSVGQTTKRATAWTTLGAVLSLGSSIPMVMHLLIANSLVYLATCYAYDVQLSSIAEQHFKAGAQLLVESLTSGGEPDHAIILSAFYFTYCYMTKSKERDIQAVLQLSKAVANHVEHYKLDVLCSGTMSQSATGCGEQAPRLSKNNPSFLARMIMWLYYQDAIGCSMGHGGAFASYMAANGNRMSDIYRMSTTALELFWGDDYPVTEIIDDVENGAAVEFMHEVWTCLQDVNQYWENPDARISKESEVEQTIAALDQKAQSFSRLVAISSTPGSSLQENADFAMSYHYVLLIFHYRHKANLNKCVPQLPPCPALTPLLNIMQRTFSSIYRTHNERYMWPLFLAGIETEDAIHREWVVGKIVDPRMRRALEFICSVQGRTGRRVDMKLVKKILCGQVTSVMPLS